MLDVIYPVIGKQRCFPVYLSGIGISSPENHIVRTEGLVSHQILFTLEGEGQLHIDNQSLRIKEGCVFYVMPGVAHEYYPVDGKWSTGWVVFRGDCLLELMKNMEFPPYMCRKVTDIQTIRRVFDKIHSAAGNSVRGDEACSLLLYEYIMTVRRALLLETDVRNSESVIDAGLRYMNEHYDKDITLEELSRLCHISPQHFCRVFRLETGMRPMEYLSQKRMLEARVLLSNTNYSIAEIGRRTGYQDPAYFGTVFKKSEGISPSDYRKSRVPVIL